MLASIGLGLAVRFLVPIPPEISLQAWTLLSIFVSTIAGRYAGAGAAECGMDMRAIPRIWCIAQLLHLGAGWDTQAMTLSAPLPSQASSWSRSLLGPGLSWA